MDENKNSNSAVTNEQILGLMDTVRKLYLADDIPWVVGYSGGKDSTATLQLVWLSIKDLPVEQRKKTVHIINTDTLVESPVVAKWAKNSLQKMDEIAKKENLPFVTHRLTPEYDNTFWVNFLGKGYPFPRKKFRWCTDRLKIQPVNKFIKEQIAEQGEIILVLGTRKAESANRARTMAYYESKRVRELLSPNPTLANELVFSPLSEWTDDDVWIFLMLYENPWGYSNQNLLTLYKGATADGECPLMVEKDLPSCGKSRFGCWVCTMVEKDKSMEAMIANDDEKAWMIPLLEFRNEFGDEENDRERRVFTKMGGHLQGAFGRLNHGPYKKEWREKWLERLLQIQKEINEIIPEEFAGLELITKEELRNIRRIWVEQKHEFDDRLPIIYKKVLGKEFDDPTWIAPEAFREEEWQILAEVCRDVCKNTEQDQEILVTLMSSIIDVENRASTANKRKGIANELRNIIQHHFYLNEEDALKYYTDRINRKKEFGGKYEEKFYVKEDDLQVMYEEFAENVEEKDFES